MNIIYVLTNLLLLFYGALSLKNCGHSELKIEIQYTDEPKEGQRRMLNSADFKPMRLTFDYSDLSNLPQDLQQVIKKQVDITAEFFQKNLHVKRIIGNNIFPSHTNQCFNKSVPAQDQSTGVPDSDMHIYVRHVNDSSSGAVASAGGCIFARDTSRPVFGMIKYNWANIKVDKIGTDGHEFEDLLETTAHELVHALGFSGSLYQYFKDENGNNHSNPIGYQTIRGLNTTIIQTPKVKALTREYYGCNTLPGMQLENSGGSGSLGSHWERVILENEFMTASEISHDAVITDFTWALLEDSGWYKPTYAYSEKIHWGKGQGCDFFTSCDPSSFREFTSEEKACNYMYTAGGYFDTPRDPFAENCPIINMYSNKYCVKASNQIDSNNNVMIEYGAEKYGPNSRCFTSNVLSNRVSLNNPDSNYRCLEMKCSAGAQQIQVFIEGEVYDIDKATNKVDVVPRGSNANVEGEVKGPADWDHFCNHYPKVCDNYCSMNGFCIQNRCHCLKDFAGKDCSIECANNQYVFNNTCINSTTCPNETIQFDEPTKHCVTCGSNQVYHIGQCLTSCPMHFYKDGNKCSPCSSDCASCQNGDTCETCEENFHLLLKQNTTSNYKCVSSCPSNNFVEQSNNTCTTCHETCLTCSNSTSCDTCITDYAKQGGEQLCSLVCIDGCQECTQADSCDTCDPARAILSVNSTTTCPTNCPSNGYYKNITSNICEQCSQNCTQCSSDTECSSCKNGTYLQNNTCITCPQECETCSSSSQCDTCASSYLSHTNPNSSNLECLQSCPQNYQESNKTCIEQPQANNNTNSTSQNNNTQINNSTQNNNTQNNNSTQGTNPQNNNNTQNNGSQNNNNTQGSNSQNNSSLNNTENPTDNNGNNNSTDNNNGFIEEPDTDITKKYNKTVTLVETEDDGNNTTYSDILNPYFILVLINVLI